MSKIEVAPPTHLLRPGTLKLGDGVRQFSIPAEDTCPGRTPFCVKFCNMVKLTALRPSVEAAYREAYEFSLTPRFAPSMIHAIKGSRAGVVRVHASGDFYSKDYAARWITIARACPETAFYAYTRSWRSEDILPALMRLAALPNFQMWWSEDRDTGASPTVAGVKVAFLVVDGADEALADPARHDLVFRDARHRTAARGRIKRINGVLVCPPEQWPARRRQDPVLETHPGIQCSTCRICFRDKMRRLP